MQDDQEQPGGRQSARLRSKPAQKLWQAPKPAWGGARAGSGRPKGAKDKGSSRKKRNCNARTTQHLNLQHHASQAAAKGYQQRKAVLDAAQRARSKEALVQRLTELSQELRQHDPEVLLAALQQLRPVVEQAAAAERAGGSSAAALLEGGANAGSMAHGQQEQADPNLLGSASSTAAAAAVWAVAAAALAGNLACSPPSTAVQNVA
ncbi:D-amino-acid oxidase [Chlorella sorokiniana]|uniref:D-amino-acid oxidase n=1 Tax=Chlorella sorokiniana TaxID=3076 RepID=A0A2P6TZ74_CHLSO|nr:D-amino-acid oxidase [Chlorella sorokiniana]|eukprot:PRW59364.1 D-amino-acid oxidase [Chlorella sorokiniana]